MLIFLLKLCICNPLIGRKSWKSTLVGVNKTASLTFYDMFDALVGPMPVRANGMEGIETGTMTLGLGLA